jgi:carboxyl-terminal processing protease
MEENKELENTTEEQASVTPAANNGEKKGLFLSGFIVGFAATLLIVGGIFIAFQIHNIMTMKDDVAAQVSYGEDSAVNAQTIKKLQLLEDTVKENFYLSEVTNEQLEDGMFRGLMDSLDDPYSEYYTAEELNELTEQTQGIYFGIGAYVSMDSETNLPKISGVIEGAPAADVDLRANDIIYEVDGVSTAGKTLTEAVNMIRGEAGTTVDLTIVRQGAGDYLHVTVERAKVESPTVKYEMLDDNMAYIQIVEFDDVTIDQFTDALATVKGSGMEGLILDLRGNPGGSLDAVVKIARKLLPDDLGLVRMGQLLSINIYLTTGRLLQEIHASHGGGFTGTGGSDDNQLLAFFYFQIYIFQYLEISEILTYIFQSDHFAPPFYVPGRNF